MAVETDADRAIFVSAEDFGAEVTWALAGGGSATFDAMFDAEYQLRAPQRDEGMEGSTPMLTARQIDLPTGAAQDDTATIGGTAYRVVEIMPDGRGMATIRLMEA